MRKRGVATLGMIVLMLLVLSPAAAQTKSVYWQRWDVTIDNMDTTSNSFDVTEDYDISFTGTFQFGEALIPMDKLDDIRNIQVFEAGQALRAGCADRPGTFCAQDASDGKSIVYNFTQPITSGRQTFSLKYTVVGGLRVYPAGDQLWWIAIPSDHYGFSIGSSTISVQMPKGYEPREGIDPVETYGVPADIHVAGQTITAKAKAPMGGSDSLEIRVQYPHDPKAHAPSWQAAFDQHQQFMDTTEPWIVIGSIVLSLIVGGGGLLGLYALWYTRGRDPKIGPVPEYLSELPSNLPPAIVGTLIDERADLRDILSTFIDLGHRGYLVIEETQTEGFMGIGKHSEFTFKRTDKSLDDLRVFERRIMVDLFGANRMERSLSSLRNTFYQYIPQLESDLYNEIVKEGLFNTSPRTTRQMWSMFGGVILALAIVGGFLLSGVVDQFSPSLLCIPFALGLVGVVWMIVAQVMPAKTRKGAEEAAKWHAFLNYLHNLEKYSTVEGAAAHFDDFLPYAVAFGLDRLWVRRFSQVATVPVPMWYYPTYFGGPYSRGYVAGTPVGRGLPSSGSLLPGDVARAGGGGLNQMAGGLSAGLNNISNGLTTMLNSAAGTLTSRPQSSSSSGHWSGGGRSWSGGGSHGGGGGGGHRGFG